MTVTYFKTIKGDQETWNTVLAQAYNSIKHTSYILGCFDTSTSLKWFNDKDHSEF